MKTWTIPRAFIWRRLHSLTGLWLVLFLIIHLLANSQAALFVGENGSGFVKAANDIRLLPYLPAIEILLLAIPFAIHIYWGVVYLFTARVNSIPNPPTPANMPTLPEYPRNHAYTWQRITSWILLVLIALHVIQMRFLEQPTEARKGNNKYYIVRVANDAGLAALSERIGTKIYTKSDVENEQKQTLEKVSDTIPEEESQALLQKQKNQELKHWSDALNRRPLGDNHVLAVANDFGTAELLMVRETFKMPAMLILYTVLVLSACFHAFNGVWTFMITWGVTLSVHSQKLTRYITTIFMLLLGFLGLAAVWGTYWINLKQ